MEPNVVTVAPERTLKDAAALLVRHRISGLPVCGPDGRVVGVVSEADIIVKEQGPPERGSSVTVADAMTSPAITVESKASVGTAAKLMLTRRVNRLPVVEGDDLVGIVTRADLVRAFARTDREIEREIRDDVLLATLCISPWSLTVGVHGGVVTLRGRVETKGSAELVAAYTRRVPGVVAVESDLRWDREERAGHAAPLGLGFLRNV